MLIGDLLRRRAALSPHVVFWEAEDGRHTYAELDAAANRVAHALRAEGLRPGDRAAVADAGGFAYAAVHFGAAKAGVLLAHLNARSSAPELAALLARLGPAIVLYGSVLAPAIAAARAALAGGGRAPARWILLPGAPVGEAAREPASPPWAAPFGGWLEPHSAAEPEALACPPETPFQLLYTSGTTGVPKGVLIGHRAKLRQGMTHALNLGLAAGDRVLSSLPLYHQYGQWLALVAVPLTGATLVARRRFDPAEAWADLRGGAITHLPAVPTTLQRLMDAPAAAGAAPPALRQITYGGAPIAAERVRELRRRFPAARLFQGFGQTETGYCLGLHDGDHDRRPDALGKPDVFSEVRLLDEQGREVPEGAVGEIVARTPYLMAGYLDDPEASAAYFAFGRAWGRTGDLARRDAEGYFTMAGRKRELVISGGENIYPAEIEQALHGHPAVAEAAAFGVPHADWGETVVAAVLLRPGARATEPDLIAHCRARLAAFKCPRRLAILADLPRTASGKVRKPDLRAAWLAGRIGQDDPP
ncbi:MAG: AMP-binding protein [Candidatus Lambdaproteobacteria bacterium]|nr:AMP-binding protein [Candidatus Lambdaproteobacteria bacterium]